MKHRAPSLKSSIAIALLSALWVTSPAGAVPIIDTFDPADTTIATGSPLSFVHEITDNGFIVGSDTITSATVAIHLTDPAGGGTEDYTFTIGSAPQIFSSNNVPSGLAGETQTVTFDVPSLADLQLDGKIDIEVSATSGSFMFADSVLTVHTPRLDAFEISQTEQVPEPSTLLLLGAGVAAVGWRFRRRS